MQVENCKINTLYGDFDFYCFNFGKHEDDNILCLKTFKIPKNPLIRIQSACFTVEIFRSTDCDCHEQLDTSLKAIQTEGGFLFYLLQDGRGAGIFKKVKGLKLGNTDNLDTAQAYEHLNIDLDPRKYDRLKEVVNYFSIKDARLLTNNPRKIKGLEDTGVKVRREPLEIEPTNYSRSYLTTKKHKMGHLFTKYIK